MNYKVYQGDELKQTVTDKIAVMNGLQPNQSYDFSVEPDNGQTGADGKTSYTHIAYADSADGTDGFTTVYPNFSLINTSDIIPYANDDPNFKNNKTRTAYLYSRGAVMDNGLYLNNFSRLSPNTTYTQTFNLTFTSGNVTDFYIFSTCSSVNNYSLSINGTVVSTTQPRCNGVISYSFTQNITYAFKIKFSTQATVTADYFYGWILQPWKSTATAYSLKLDHIKLEQGTVATPWMPSTSEVTTADYPSYIGQYTDLTQADSTNPSDYTWIPIRDGDATRDGTKKTISVTTRGIRFNIPKTLTVDSTITLRYEEYPLGIVPIGNEPSGFFGGGNKQNLSAKVISTANGSSVVEVAGNVIEVGGKNLLIGTSGELSGKSYNFADYQISGGLQPGTTYTLSGWARVDQKAIDNHQHVFAFAFVDDWSWSAYLDIDASLTANYKKVTFTTPSVGHFCPHIYVDLSHPNGDGSKDSISGTGYISKLKLEPSSIATPYAAFVDGDTFTAQPDGTCALFSEYKALYY